MWKQGTSEQSGLMSGLKGENSVKHVGVCRETKTEKPTGSADTRKRSGCDVNEYRIQYFGENI